MFCWFQYRPCLWVWLGRKYCKVYWVKHSMTNKYQNRRVRVCVISSVPTGLLVLVPSHDLLCRWKQTKEKLTEAELKGEKVSIRFELMEFC